MGEYTPSSSSCCASCVSGGREAGSDCSPSSITTSLLSALFPEEVAEGIYMSMDRDLKCMLGRYTSQKLRDSDDLFIEIRDLIFHYNF